MLQWQSEPSSEELQVYHFVASQTHQGIEPVLSNLNTLPQNHRKSPQKDY